MMICNSVRNADGDMGGPVSLKCGRTIKGCESMNEVSHSLSRGNPKGYRNLLLRGRITAMWFNLSTMTMHHPRPSTFTA